MSRSRLIRTASYFPIAFDPHDKNFQTIPNYRDWDIAIRKEMMSRFQSRIPG